MSEVNLGKSKAWYKPVGNEALSRRNTSVKLPKAVDVIVWSLPSDERNNWLRRVISEAVRKELITKDYLKKT